MLISPKETQVYSTIVRFNYCIFKQNLYDQNYTVAYNLATSSSHLRTLISLSYPPCRSLAGSNRYRLPRLVDSKPPENSFCSHLSMCFFSASVENRLKMYRTVANCAQGSTLKREYSEESQLWEYPGFLLKTPNFHVFRLSGGSPSGWRPTRPKGRDPDAPLRVTQDNRPSSLFSRFVVYNLCLRY